MAEQIHTDNPQVMAIYVAWQMANTIVPRTERPQGGHLQGIDQDKYTQELLAAYAKCYQAIMHSESDGAAPG